MVLGEIGQIQVDCMLKLRILNYWYKLVTNVNKFKFIVVLYRLMYKMALDSSFMYPWLDYVRRRRFRSVSSLALSRASRHRWPKSVQTDNYF